jgi:polyisoprenoid-binding protein YceI
LRRHWKWWLAGAVALVLCVTVVGPFLFLHVIEGPAPAPLSIKNSGHSRTSSPGASVALASGKYTIASGSQVEYRVAEILFGQSAIAVGKTSHITGSLIIQGSTVSAASFTVPLSTVMSNEPLRDQQFRNRIMDVAQYPDAVFALTSPIHLVTVPTVDRIISVEATGNLAIHGVTRSVTFAISAERTATVIEVSGSIPITFADWHIQNPSGGPAQVGSSGKMEFLLKLIHS